MSFEPILYDPGIAGFVKGHRHHSGPSIIMTTGENDDRDWIAVYWIKRLHFNAKPTESACFWMWTEGTMKAAERAYDLFMSMGPPVEAQTDFQRRRVYRWEEKIIFPGRDDRLDWEDCQNFLLMVWDAIGKGPAPELTNLLRAKRPLSYIGVIHLPVHDPSCWTRPVLLHEIAHELEWAAQHGPRFVSRYIKLCVRFLGMDRQLLRDTATSYDVCYQ